jgi:DNA invertase Pin-like site-specific DNA recombinase
MDLRRKVMKIGYVRVSTDEQNRIRQEILVLRNI